MFFFCFGFAITTTMNTTTTLAYITLIATTVKILLIPSYHSTDFEVHRHWLALTHSLPISLWYSDNTSIWTLDYPPFFAFFEYFLSLFPPLFDPKAVDLINGLDHSSFSFTVFHNLTVVLSDFVLIFSVYRFGVFFKKKTRSLMWVLVVFSPGLIIVDHLHFQFNGFLLGILVLSLSFLEKERDLMGGFVFASLLCFKHLFAVAGPVYFVYLLRHYCRGGFFRGFGRLVTMGTVVVAVFVVAYGPFAYYGQIQQVISRMFPFGRGLCHAYWAPNFWVFYIILDKALALSLAKLGFHIQTPTASFTGGLVGDSSPFAVLPKVTPLATFVLVLLSLLPCLAKVWRDPQPRMITRWVAYAYTCGFMFGWHVHEKASLHFVIPLALVAVQSAEDAKHYFFVSIVSCYSLFPLLYEPQEYPIKVLLLLLYLTLMWFMFTSLFNDSTSAKSKATERGFAIGWVQKSYLLGILAVEISGMVLHPIVFGDKLPFLPLVMISSYCALGMMYSWIWQLTRIIRAC